MDQGTIKKIVSDRGFGFISRDNGNDLFFHCSKVEGTEFAELREGQKVEFTEGSGPRGPAAEQVRVID